MLDESKLADSAITAGQPLTTDRQAAAQVEDSVCDKPRRLYGHRAQRRGQAKTTDLIPKRWPAYTALITLLVVSLASLNALSFYADSLSPFVGSAGVAAFSLQGTGTLASWYASLLMAGAAATCWQIYFLRKHRCDDYRGSYRIWSWLSIAFAVVCLGQSIHLASIGNALIAAAAQSAGVALPFLGVVPAVTAAGGLLFSLIVFVCMWEKRRSRASVIFTGVAWASGLVAILSSVPEFQDRIAAANLDSTFANGPLVFATCAFLAVVTYARYVYLAANGMLPVQVAPAKTAPVISKPTAPPAKAARKPAKVARPALKITTQSATQPTAAQPAAKTAAKQPAAAQADPAPAANLSKAERRRQRKLERRANRAA